MTCQSQPRFAGFGVPNRCCAISSVRSELLDVQSLERSRAAEDQLYIMDSATRSYIALGKALEATRNAENSAMHSYIANVKNSECRAIAGYDMNPDSSTRSYIAWGQALQAQRDAGMDSATRSYVAWGQALQAQGLLCS